MPQAQGAWEKGDRVGRTVVHLVVCLMLAAVGSLCLWNTTPEAAAVASSSGLQKESGGLE